MSVPLSLSINKIKDLHVRATVSFIYYTNKVGKHNIDSLYTIRLIIIIMNEEEDREELEKPQKEMGISQLVEQ